MKTLIDNKNKHIGMFPVTELLPFLIIIESQNGLNLNISREFNICRNVLVRSIVYN